MSPVFRRRDGVVERTVGLTSFLAVDDTGALYRLNETGTALWRLLADGVTRVDAVAAFRAAFPDRPYAEIAKAIARLLDELLQESLIEVIGERQPSLPSGRSHR